MEKPFYSKKPLKGNYLETFMIQKFYLKGNVILERKGGHFESIYSSEILGEKQRSY